MASKESASGPTCTPNLLPCQIHHDGLVDASERYWNPKNTPGTSNSRIALLRTSPADLGTDNSSEAYFRGRKLKGREVQVPDGYRGALVQPTASRLELASGVSSQTKVDVVPAGDEEDDDTAAENMEVVVLKENGSFDRLVVWGHEGLVEDDDPFVKGVEEWINFSQAVRICKLLLSAINLQADS